jgi:hypothetical protein
LAAVVENAEVLIVELAAAPSPHTVASIEMALGGAVFAIKLTAATFAFVIVTVWFGGLNVNPVLLGVTV